MKVLVLGGTRFFGKRLVARALAAGWDVTVATRGKYAMNLPRNVKHISVDRFNRQSMETAFANKTYDIVYDQLCYSPDDARLSCDVFRHKTGRYVLTSSAAVYDTQMLPIKESQFDPYRLPVRYGSRHDFTYADGKRHAEAVFFQQATFPVVAVRLPIVIAEDDYTGRFRFHVDRIRRGEPIGIPGKPAKMSFVSADEAGTFLYWVGTSDLHGPVNAASHTPLTALEITNMIAEEIGKEAVITTDEREGVRSPYFISQNWTLNLVHAYRYGYTFTKSKEWLPAVIWKVFRATT